MPLVFGAQRFGSSSGLAANQSDIQAGVADSISDSWLSGSFVSFGSDEETPPSGTPPNASVGRRLQKAKKKGSDLDTTQNATATQTQSLREQTMKSIVKTLSSAALSCGGVIVITVFGRWYWAHRMNRRYYEERKAMEDTKKTLAELIQSGAVRGKKNGKETKFIPLPAPLVWPALIVRVNGSHPRTQIPTGLPNGRADCHAPSRFRRWP